MESILAAVGTVLGVAAFAFFRDWRDGKSLFKKNDTAMSAMVMTRLLEGQQYMRDHYNDETTVLLRSIESRLTSLHEDLRDGFSGTAAKFREYDKYGIRARIDK